MSTLTKNEPVGSAVVVGAGIAGMTAASVLAKGGFAVTLVERESEIRGGGHLVSISDKAHRTAERIGALPSLKNQFYRIDKSSYHQRNGNPLLKLSYASMFGDLQVLQPTRDQLAQAILETMPDGVNCIRGAVPIALDRHADGVSLTLDNGASISADFIIGADGVHSVVRDLAFPPETITHHKVGLCCAAFRLPNLLGLDREFRTYMERDRYMAAYTTAPDEIGAVFVWADQRSSVPKEPKERVDLLRNAFKDAGPQIQAVLKEVPLDTWMYMDSLKQVELSSWHKDRVCLVGDAAHCLTLFSGRGAAAAMAGAADLADCLVTNPKDPNRAFEDFASKAKPKLDAMQKATRSAIKWYVPRSTILEMLRNGAMWALPTAVFEAYFRKKYSNV